MKKLGLLSACLILLAGPLFAQYISPIEGDDCPTPGDFVTGYDPVTGARNCATPGGGVISPANPTATAGPTAVNGAATTYMRSDAAPAVQLGSSSQSGLIQCGTGTSCTGGVLSVSGGSAASYAAIGWIAGTNPDKTIIFTATTASTITGIIGTVDTPVGAAATISIYKAPSGTACASGTSLISGSAFNANGTAVTNQTIGLAGAGAPSLSAGDRVCLSTANGAQFLSGGGIGGITIAYTVP